MLHEPLSTLLRRQYDQMFHAALASPALSAAVNGVYDMFLEAQRLEDAEDVGEMTVEECSVLDDLHGRHEASRSKRRFDDWVPEQMEKADENQDDLDAAVQGCKAPLETTKQLLDDAVAQIVNNHKTCETLELRRLIADAQRQIETMLANIDASVEK